ncbi:MAG: bifunctional DNA-formamidopyrimidine glycosylase/DNA-(apurinic or apyrimidinic site) lyase [Chloroflexi bacterium]|nr:bifunctional DNA-formamidopyrimidine glycosylase/DNA-(apurinic or apyrimidinic site) lyase [Chloroflexota bacterium]
MPELPEAETICRDLAPHLVGRTIAEMHVYWEKAIAYVNEEAFAAALTGRRVEGVARRGKYPILTLSAGLSLLIHLKMTGRLLLCSRDDPLQKQLSVVFDLDEGRQLRFADQRRFGRLYLLDTDGLAKRLSELGPEPLEPAFTPDVLASLLRGRKARIKPLLMDQSLIAGLGNIYSDEALFEAGIHPLRTADDLTDEEVAKLHRGIRVALSRGLVNRGTSFSDYLDGFGQPGSNQFHLGVYRRTGQPCSRCGTAIERLRLGSRHAHYCPNCQAVKS